MNEKLIQILKERKYSILKISKLSGVSARTISSWLYYGAEPNLTKAEKVLNSLGYKIIIKEVNTNEIKTNN